MRQYNEFDTTCKNNMAFQTREDDDFVTARFLIVDHRRTINPWKYILLHTSEI